MLHGHCNHTTDECKVLKKQTERLKQNRNNGQNNYQQKKQELNNLQQVMVDKAAAKAHNQVVKRNKAAKAARKAAEAKITEEELRNFETLSMSDSEVEEDISSLE